MFGVYIFITQYLQLVLGLTPLQAGLATVPWALAFVVGSLLAPRLARRWPPVSILVGGWSPRRSASRCWRWSTTPVGLRGRWSSAPWS